MVFKFSEKSFSHCDFSAETSPPSGQNDAFLESCKLACSLLGNLDLDNLLCPPINPIDLLKSHFIFSTILRDYNTFAFEEKTCFPSIISKVLLRKSVMPPRLPPPPMPAFTADYNTQSKQHLKAEASHKKGVFLLAWKHDCSFLLWRQKTIYRFVVFMANFTKVFF